MLEKSDKFIILCSFMLFSFFAFRFVTFDDSVAVESSNKLIAQASNVELVAKRKVNGSLGWSNLSSNSSIYNGDQIFTDSKSQVEIIFNDKSSLTVPENTLIKIEKNVDGIDIDLKKGLVDLDFSKFKNTKVRIQLGDRKIQLSGSKSAIVKIKRVEGNITLRSNGEEFTASEIPQGTSKVLKQESIKIKKNEQIKLRVHNDEKWQENLAKVGKRVDSRLVMSQYKKVEIILGEEFNNVSQKLANFKTESKSLLRRSQELEMTPKKLILSELKILKKYSNKKDARRIKVAIRRLKTIRNIAPLKTSVEKYIEAKFPDSKVLQNIANEEIRIAAKTKKYKSNEELFSSIGKKFDKLKVKEKPRINSSSFQKKVSLVGKSVNKSIAYSQLKVIKNNSPSDKVLKSSEIAFESIYKETQAMSPLQVASIESPKFSKQLKKFDKSKKINNEILKELTPLLKREYSTENVDKVIKYISSYKFSSSKLKIDEDLTEIFNEKLISIKKNDSQNWNDLLTQAASNVDKEVKLEKNLNSVNSEVVLKNIRNSLLISKNDSSYQIIEKEVNKINFNKSKNTKKELQKISKKLELKKINTPRVYRENTWARKFSAFSKTYEQNLVSAQKEELVSQIPELKYKFITTKSLITKSPKQEIKSLLSKKGEALKNVSAAKLEKALLNTQDISVEKQDLFERINESFSLENNPEAREIVQKELREVRFANDDFAVEEVLVKIGQKLDSLNINPVSTSSLPKVSFLGTTTVISKPIISKALPEQIEAGVDVKLSTSKSMKGISSYEVEFSKDKNFKQITYKKKITSKTQKLNFTKEGKFFYRVSKTTDTEEDKSFDIAHTLSPKKYSPIKTIEIVAAKAPEVVVSNNGAIDTKTFSSFPIKWSGKSNTQYEVEITQKSPKTQNVIVKKKFLVSTNKVNIDLSKANLDLSLSNNVVSAKNISYRVRKSGRVKSSWSKPAVSSVSIPMVVMPVQDKAVFVKKRFKKKSVIPFKWKSSFKNDTHVLTVARDKDFKSLIVKKEVVGETAEVTTSHEGPIFWKVVPKKLSSTSTSSVSPVMQKSILSSTIRIDKKIVKSTIELSKKDLLTKVKVGWRYTRKAYTKLAQVELATDPNFKNIISKKSVAASKKRAEFQVKGVGQYFWRVKDVGVKAKNISGVNSFSIVENVELAIPQIPKKQIIRYKIVNDLPAYEIKLPNVIGASVVELEVYSDKDLTKLVFRKRFKRKKALWVTNRSGKFFYRVRSVSKTGRKSKFSPAGKLIFPISPLIRSDLE